MSFEEAQTIFADAFSITYEDAEHSLIEERLLEIGFSQQNRLLAVIYVERSETVRLISARLATAQERRDYETVD